MTIYFDFKKPSLTWKAVCSESCTYGLGWGENLLNRGLKALTKNFGVIIFILACLVIVTNATAELTREDIRQIVREEAPDTGWIGAVIGFIAAGIIGGALIVYHHTKNISDKTSEVRDLKKDIAIMTSKVSEDHEYIVEMYKEQSERINNIENSVERIEKSIGSIYDHLLRFEDYFIILQEALKVEDVLIPDFNLKEFREKLRENIADAQTVDE